MNPDEFLTRLRETNVRAQAALQTELAVASRLTLDPAAFAEWQQAVQVTARAIRKFELAQNAYLRACRRLLDRKPVDPPGKVL